MYLYGLTGLGLGGFCLALARLLLIGISVAETRCHIYDFPLVAHLDLRFRLIGPDRLLAQLAFDFVVDVGVNGAAVRLPDFDAGAEDGFARLVYVVGHLVEELVLHFGVVFFFGAGAIVDGEVGGDEGVGVAAIASAEGYV